MGTYYYYTVIVVLLLMCEQYQLVLQDSDTFPLCLASPLWLFGCSFLLPTPRRLSFLPEDPHGTRKESMHSPIQKKWSNHKYFFSFLAFLLPVRNFTMHTIPPHFNNYPPSVLSTNFLSPLMHAVSQKGDWIYIVSPLFLSFFWGPRFYYFVCFFNPFHLFFVQILGLAWFARRRRPPPPPPQ